jgi:hypothetical protein
MTEIEIDEVFTQTFQIKKYRFIVFNHFLHKSVSLNIYLMDMNGDIVHTIPKLIEGEEYGAWGTDDSYLEGIVDKIVKEFFLPGVKVPPCPPCEICESMCGGH